MSPPADSVNIVRVATFLEWRNCARQLLAHEVAPEQVHFRCSDGQPGLFDTDQPSLQTQAPTQPPAQRRGYRVPPTFLKLAEEVACHRDSDRWERLYRTLWRLTHGEPHLLQVTTDEDVYRLVSMQKAVDRDSHKMKAFVRFRRVVDSDDEHFVAWHRPDHHVVRLTAPFFARRFPSMRWSILTPTESVAWNLTQLQFGPGVPASQAPNHDELEHLWKTYYGSIFNPARIKLNAMTREMPARHWATLPETDIIPDLLADASRRVQQMIALQEGIATSAADFLPADRDLDSLRQAAAGCQGCPLHGPATQTVFGQGPATARLVLVGEQPGDLEDRSGQPFVGPAGEILNQALQQAGIARKSVYVTNAVKHFKHEPRGKKRLHKRPDPYEISACKPWVAAELTAIQPQVLVCLGATAAQQLIGRGFRITSQRGQLLPTEYCQATLATWHPAAILRNPSAAGRDQMQATLTADLQLAAETVRLLSDH